DIEFSGGIVIKEEQRLRTLDYEVVDAHCHQILADAAKPSCFNGDFQFRPDTVGARHQHRIAKTSRFEIKEATEAAKISLRARPAGGTRSRCHPAHECVAAIEIDAVVLVG